MPAALERRAEARPTADGLTQRPWSHWQLGEGLSIVQAFATQQSAQAQAEHTQQPSFVSKGQCLVQSLVCQEKGMMAAAGPAGCQIALQLSRCWGGCWGGLQPVWAVSPLVAWQLATRLQTRLHQARCHPVFLRLGRPVRLSSARPEVNCGYVAKGSISAILPASFQRLPETQLGSSRHGRLPSCLPNGRPAKALGAMTAQQV